MSQPTLSEQIKKLEELLDLKIFERNKKRVQVTPQGLLLITVGKNIIKEAKHFINVAKSKSKPLSGEFNLGAIATVGPYYFPYIIEPIKKKFPDLELILQEGKTDELLAKLDRGELDAVIASRTLNEKNYRVYSLYKEPFWFAAPKQMLIKNKQGKISTNDIDKEKLILLSDGNCLKDEVLNFCSMTHNQLSSKIQATSIETLLCLVASTNGCTFVPQLAIKADKRLDRLLNYYSFSEKDAYREIALFSREQYARPDDIRLLYHHMKGVLPHFS